MSQLINELIAYASIVGMLLFMLVLTLIIMSPCLFVSFGVYQWMAK